MDLSHFDFRGDIDTCHADSNDSYPYDELLYIWAINSYFEDNALEEYEEDRSIYKGIDGYREIADLGDKAFIQTKEQLGKLDFAYIGVVKGIYTVRIEVNGDYSTSSNNRFMATSVLDLAQVIVEAIED